jgi:hypothetical protein
MKKIYLLLLLLSFSVNTMYSQTVETAKQTTLNVDPRIIEVYGDQLQTLVLNVPNRLYDLTDILNNRVKIEELKYDKDEKFLKFSSVDLFLNSNPNLKRDAVVDNNNFNPLKYNLRFHANYTLIYRIDNTDKVIVIYPQPKPVFNNN